MCTLVYCQRATVLKRSSTPFDIAGERSLLRVHTSVGVEVVFKDKCCPTIIDVAHVWSFTGVEALVVGQMAASFELSTAILEVT